MGAYTHDFKLDRTHAASCRLNLQHYLWREALEYDIHPSIPVSKNSIIADIACGTGLWLMQVARKLPDAELDGLDIDLAQATSEQCLPPNVRLRKWNIFDDVPGDLAGKYDYIHVRLLILVIENSDP